MAVLGRVIVILVCLSFGVLTAKGVGAAGIELSPVSWKRLEPGLDLGRVVVTFVTGADSGGPGESATEPVSFGASVTLLRINPENYVFSLYMASEKGPGPLARVAEKERFVAAINAGMFRQDQLTGTGFLKNAGHINNGRIAANLGAFFVAEPLKPGIPRARLLDRTVDNWQRDIDHYGIVMQNYRMNTRDGEIIWKRRERLHSISALSQDEAGNIYFIFCPNFVQGADFAAALLRMPLKLRTIMYLEGGTEAALLIRAGGVAVFETGPQFWGQGEGLTLPNVLGLRRKGAKP